MRVLLVNPPKSRGEGYIVIPNLGLGYLASSIDHKKHSTQILDMALTKHGAGELPGIVSEGRHEVLGISTFSCSWNAARACVKAVKQSSPGVVTVLGGPHPTFEPAECMDGLPELDYAFVAESELGFPKFLDHLAANGNGDGPALESIPGLVFRNGGRVRANEPGYLQSLDSNPIPAWDLLKPDRYPTAPNGIFSRRPKIAPLITTRGCPHSCTFCGAAAISGRTYRHRNPDNILSEIELLMGRYGISEFHILDDLFTLDKRFVREVCEKIIERGLDIAFSLTSGVRLDSLEKNLLVLMEKAGCYSMAVGIESGSDRILEDMRKKLTVGLVKEKVSLIKSSTSIRVTGFFIVGYPTETIEDAQGTIRLSLALPLDRANYFNFSPFPGSPIYNQLKREGKLGGLDYDRLYIHSLSFDHPSMSRKTLRALQRNAHLRFYLRPRILLGLAREVKTRTQLWIIAKRALAVLGLAGG